jgi:hypothetical protein
MTKGERRALRLFFMSLNYWSRTAVAAARDIKAAW